MVLISNASVELLTRHNRTEWYYPFPENITLQETLEAVSKSNLFEVIEDSNMITFDYVQSHQLHYNKKNMFPYVDPYSILTPEKRRLMLLR
jgi:hypothetical protein